MKISVIYGGKREVSRLAELIKLAARHYGKHINSPEHQAAAQIHEMQFEFGDATQAEAFRKDLPSWAVALVSTQTLADIG
jgi:hypothetical protein